MRWQSRRASGAETFGKSTRPEETTTPAQVAEPANNKKSVTASLGTEHLPKTSSPQWTKTAMKFYLAFGLAGIWTASMARTLSEGKNKMNKQPTGDENGSSKSNR